ncbi:SPOR domain-containing protein [Paracidovorax valerianellae]|uniref:DedD protein n=1 Tax=Paracidovorax valerianellae TaxID=187868 RepID=A0A1G6YK39_9BURK|nr:SPOR domain-containing protein [Paracidovorax valerianellae]MDA8445733.1 SPOR domain-containing protein [Paracidovorax valerianellae]SDD90651.1 DedD protein [Paracidovorax valerianellae]
MAFFKFRWPGSKEQPDKPAGKRSRNAQAESIEAMRRRARHRLIGAAVLVLLGVVGFPILFDTQPRPIPVDIPIDIPDRNKVAPLVVPESAAPARPAASATAMASSGGLAEGEEVVPSSRATPKPPAPAPVASAVPSVTPKPEVRAEPKPAPRPEPKPVHETKPEPKPEPKPEVKPQRSEDAARARALLEGREAGAAPAASASKAEEGRLIVQVGAFADADKAREVRQSLERAGLKTYTQVVDTKDGKRTRVRVGPYASRADADKAAARVKGLGLSASVLAI